MIHALAFILAAATAPGGGTIVAEVAIPVDRSTPPPAAKPQTVTPAARAAGFYEALRHDAVDRKLVTDAFSSELTPATVHALATALDGLGVPSSFAPRAIHVVDGATIYDFTVTLPAGAVAVTMGIDEATGLISKFYVRRAAAPAELR